MPRLVLLGGPPGIGKSTVIKDPQLNKYICLEADQICPPRRSGYRSEVISTIVSAVDRKLSAGRTVILAWVFARSALYQPFIDHFPPKFQIQQIYLVCEPKVLQEKLHGRNTPELSKYALVKLNLIEALPFDKIDTTDMAARDVARALRSAIQSNA